MINKKKKSFEHIKLNDNTVVTNVKVQMNIYDNVDYPKDIGHDDRCAKVYNIVLYI